jgi:chromosome condensin MukBEF MukE localization factor
MYEFETNEEIQQITSRCLSLKFCKTTGIMPLSEVYNSFLQKKYNTKLLKLVEQNKIGEI